MHIYESYHIERHATRRDQRKDRAYPISVALSSASSSHSSLVCVCNLGKNVPPTCRAHTSTTHANFGSKERARRSLKSRCLHCTSAASCCCWWETCWKSDAYWAIPLLNFPVIYRLTSHVSSCIRHAKCGHITYSKSTLYRLRSSIKSVWGCCNVLHFALQSQPKVNGK